MPVIDNTDRLRAPSGMFVKWTWRRGHVQAFIQVLFRYALCH